MKLSIITCTYNSEKFLKQTLDSVGSQKLSDKHTLQHIILDGLSTDATSDIVEQYKKDTKASIDIRFVQKPPKGIFNAFNEGIRASDGEYILVLPSDDFLMPDILEDYLNFIESTEKKDLYYAKRNTYNNTTGKNIGVPYPNRGIYYHWLHHLILGLSCYISQPTVIAKRDLHERFGFYNESLRLVSDWEFYIKITIGGASSQFYDRVVTNFRVHEWSATTGNITAVTVSEQEEIYVFKKYYTFTKYFFIWLRTFYRKFFY